VAGVTVNPVNVAYLVTGILFILGLRYLSSPRTARLGNRLAAVGMLVALVAVLTQGIVQWWIVALGVVVGAAIGIYSGASSR
jgi:NAD(P) transhydrogenase subunit beta